MKVLVFAEPGHYAILFQPLATNLSYDQCCPFSDHTNVTGDLQLLSLVQRLWYTTHKLHLLATRF